ncbi:hypothetical protein C0068_19365 [Zhongshania marina]|uniref:Uncharacterized protein n=1 Tax=Zhongshania marina TaxID=2304603 RepID=A0A2S4HAJ6_9GAMM|nr:hypothetical protein C0068_19365 [Marortus luteolus]
MKEAVTILGYIIRGLAELLARQKARLDSFGTRFVAAAMLPKNNHLHKFACYGRYVAMREE